MIVTVWETKQSALYKSEKHFSRAEKPRADTCRKSAPKNMLNDLFADRDTLLILGLIMVLMGEKTDRKLIIALMTILLM